MNGIILSTRKSKVKQIGWIRRCRYFFLRLLRLRGTPQTMARGWASGVFAGFFPLFGVQTIIGVLLASLMRGNKLVAVAGTWVSNPLTYIPIYVFNFQVGKLLLGGEDLATNDINWKSFSELLELGFSFIFTLFTGCFVVGFIAGLVTYFLSLWLTVRWRNSRQKRRKL